jgi:hypothetical protein
VLLVACLIPGAQRLVIATLDFNMVRILIVFGWLRLALRGELRPLKLNAVDLAFVSWIVLAGTGYVLRQGDFGSFVYRLGFAFDALGIYFLFRMLLRHPADTVRSSRYMAWCAAAVAVGITIEWTTGHNLFSIFGGVPEYTWIREGRLRCQGAFSHPIMAGTFGGTLVPVFAGMWLAFPKWRVAAVVGAVSGLVIVAASASSGPALAVVAGFAAWCCWPLRRRMRALRWGLLLGAIALHFAREKPIWHLAARASDVMGGEGYHRYALIDAFIRNWREWWLVGIHSTDHWGFMLWDTTNQYVQEGVTGGILALLAFLATVVLGFQAVGIAGKSGRAMSLARAPRAQRLWCWGLGAGLTAHAAAFMGVSYWGQIQFVLYLFFSVIAAELSFARAGHRALARERSREPVPAPALVQEPAES